MALLVPEGFQDLAQALALNHVYLSTQPLKQPDSTPTEGQFQRASAHFLGRDGSTIPPRIIVVLGAGASNAACSLPTGTRAAEILKKELSRKSRVNRPGIAGDSFPWED